MERKPHPDILEVSLIDGKSFFPISWLHKQCYCEYQIFLENFKGVITTPTASMIIGKERHEKLEMEHNEKAEGEITIEGAIKKSKKDKIAILLREVYVYGSNSQILGKIDEISIYPDKIVIIDDKPGDRVFDSHKKQVWGYCLAFRESHKPKVPLFAAVRNRDTQEIIWKEEFTGDAEQEVSESIQRIHELISGKREFEPTRNPNKCRSCRFNKERKCDKVAM